MQMTDVSTEGQAFYHNPPWYKRIWSILGFGHAHAEMHDDHPDFAPGALITDTFTYLDWGDRFRVLISGKINIESRTQTDVAVKYARTNTNVRVLPPTHSMRLP
jgi:hypothetical protein